MNIGKLMTLKIMIGILEAELAERFSILTGRLGEPKMSLRGQSVQMPKGIGDYFS